MTDKFDANALRQARAALPAQKPLYTVHQLPEGFLSDYRSLLEAMCDENEYQIRRILRRSSVPYSLVNGTNERIPTVLYYFIDNRIVSDATILSIAPVVFPYTDGLKRTADGETLLDAVKRKRRGPEVEQMIREFMEFEIAEKRAGLENTMAGNLLKLVGAQLSIESPTVVGALVHRFAKRPKPSQQPVATA